MNMRYTISESQKNKIEKVIVSYFVDNLTPDIDWSDVEEDILKNDNRDRPSSYDLHLDDSGYNTYVYVNCEYLDKYVGEDHGFECPQILLPYDIWNSLEGLFGPIWKPMFIKWFNSKMKFVRIKDVDLMD
jgi:hypothetical protein